LSSILKALKRVEESGPAEETLNHPPSVYEAAALRPSWRHKAWFSGRNRVYLLASLIVLAIAGAAYHRWAIDGAAPPAAGGASEVRAPLPPRPPDPPPQVASAPARPAPPPAQPPETVKDPVQAPPPTSRVRPREGPAAPPAETRPSPTRTLAAPAVRPDTGRPSPPRTAEDNLSRLDESKLKVMAIAWTTEASRRLAVVNGHIVKEGESVEGFNVTQIRKDDIIVNDGGRSWRVELNLKGQP
jgi:type IV secretory pathway VirB10-like protein